MDLSQKKSVRIRVNGRVQGVAFRYYTKINADKLDLKGTVQNMKDGSVLIHVYGSNNQVEELVAWCEAGGSPPAVVNQVIIDELDAISSNQYFDFSIIR